MTKNLTYYGVEGFRLLLSWYISIQLNYLTKKKVFFFVSSGLLRGLGTSALEKCGCIIIFKMLASNEANLIRVWLGRLVDLVFVVLLIIKNFT